MLNIYAVIHETMHTLTHEQVTDDHSVIWCDLYEPTQEEEAWVESHLGVDVPTREEMNEIELSNRLYVENDATYMTTSIVTRTDTPEPQIHAITFVLKDQCLVTVRYADPFTFRVFSKKLAQESKRVPCGDRVLMGLLEGFVARLADIIENIVHGLDTTNHVIFRPALATSEER